MTHRPDAWLRICLIAVTSALGLPSAASAQTRVPATSLVLNQPLAGIKSHVSFMVSGGFDLDVFGDVIMGASGANGGRSIAIREARPWPDVYVAVPKHTEISVGYGVFQHDEIVGRFARANYRSEPLTDAGTLAGPAASEGVTLDVSPYKERSWEGGWRHYLVMTRRAKQYANILYGVRTVEPISAILSASPDGRLASLRLYDRTRSQSFSLELGLTVEVAHVGVYAEVGGRWQQKLRRIDDDLAAWGLQPVNDTGARFYMPLQFGVVFRL